MLISVFPRHWESRRQNWELPVCLQITVATSIARTVLTTVASEVFHDICKARLSNVCLGDVQDKAGLQTCLLPVIAEAGKREKMEMWGTIFSHVSLA